MLAGWVWAILWLFAASAFESIAPDAPCAFRSVQAEMPKWNQVIHRMIHRFAFLYSNQNLTSTDKRDKGEGMLPTTNSFWNVESRQFLGWCLVSGIESELKQGLIKCSVWAGFTMHFFPASRNWHWYDCNACKHSNYLIGAFQSGIKCGVSFQLSSKPCEPFFLSLSRFVSNLPLISLALSKGTCEPSSLSGSLWLLPAQSCSLWLFIWLTLALSGSRYGSQALFEGNIVQERETINKVKDDKPEYP